MKNYVNSWEIEFMKDKAGILTSGIVKNIAGFYDCDEDVMVAILMNHLANGNDG